MLVFSTSLPNLRLIVPLTAKIYNRTGITVTHRQTNTHNQSESDTLPIYDIGSSNDRAIMVIFYGFYSQLFCLLLEKRLGNSNTETKR